VFRAYRKLFCFFAQIPEERAEVFNPGEGFFKRFQDKLKDGFLFYRGNKGIILGFGFIVSLVAGNYSEMIGC